MSDFRAACIHGRYETHRFEAPDYEWAKWESCPGGRQVTIDYEAARLMFTSVESQLIEYADGSDTASRRIVDAAIGDTDSGGST